MKKVFVLVVAIIMIFSIQPVFASAYDTDTMPRISVDKLPDGSKFITVIETVPSDGISPMATNTVTKSKTVYYEDASGNTLWYVRVTGTFTYGNGTAKCTASTPSAASENKFWKVSGISGSRSGNKCSAEATGKMYENDKVVKTITKTVTLTCSPTGQFS